MGVSIQVYRSRIGNFQSSKKSKYSTRKSPKPTAVSLCPPGWAWVTCLLLVLTSLQLLHHRNVRIPNYNQYLPKFHSSRSIHPTWTAWTSQLSCSKSSPSELQYSTRNTKQIIAPSASRRSRPNGRFSHSKQVANCSGLTCHITLSKIFCFLTAPWTTRPPTTARQRSSSSTLPASLPCKVQLLGSAILSSLTAVPPGSASPLETYIARPAKVSLSLLRGPNTITEVQTHLTKKYRNFLARMEHGNRSQRGHGIKLVH